MYCKNCDKNIPEESKHCQFCGTKINSNELKESIEDNAIESSNIPTPFEYAGFLMRLGAYIFDLGLLIIIFNFLSLVIGDELRSSIAKSDPYGSYIATVIYDVFFLATWSKTPGKALYGLKVVREATGENLPWSVAVKRSLLQILSTLFFGIGYWNMGIDRKNRAFHDKHAGTNVIREEHVNLTIAIVLTIIAGIFIIWEPFLGANSSE